MNKGANVDPWVKHTWASGIFKSRNRERALLIVMKVVNTRVESAQVLCGLGVVFKESSPELQPVN